MLDRVAALSLLVALSACKRPAPEAPWPASTISTADITRGHSVSAATAAPSLRYQSPACTPTYEWRAALSQTMDVASDAEAPLVQRLDVRGSFELRRGSSAARATLHATRFELAMAATNGERGAPISQVIPTPIDVELSDGRQWIERDGPRSTWAAMGTFPGIGLFFPTLPRGEHSESWTFTVFDPNEVRRDAQPILATAGDALDHQTLAFRSRIARWITIDGARAAVVQAHASSPDGRALRIEIESLVTERGLLLASVVRQRTMQRETVDRHTLVWSGDVRAELRLRSGCPGPMFASGFPSPSARERALTAYANLVRSVANDRRAEALSRIDPSVLSAHGEERVWTLLRSYSEQRGARSLGSTELADAPGRTQGDSFVLSITGAGRVRESPWLSLTIDLAFALSDTTARVRSIGVSSVQGSSQHDLLQLDAQSARGELAPTTAATPGSPFGGLAVDAGARRPSIFDALRAPRR